MLHSTPLHTLIEGCSSSELAINKTEPFFQRFFFLSQWIFKEKLKKSHVVHELRSIFLVIFTFNLGKRKLYITYWKFISFRSDSKEDIFSWEYNGMKIFELFLSIYKWNRNLHPLKLSKGLPRIFINTRQHDRLVRWPRKAV